MPDLSTCDRFVLCVTSPEIVGGIPPIEIMALTKATGMEIESMDLDDGSALAVLRASDPVDDAARIVGYCAIVSQRSPDRRFEIQAISSLVNGCLDLSPIARRH